MEKDHEADHLTLTQACFTALVSYFFIFNPLFFQHGPDFFAKIIYFNE